jgi:hypothetical protein
MVGHNFSFFVDSFSYSHIQRFYFSYWTGFAWLTLPQYELLNMSGTRKKLLTLFGWKKDVHVLVCGSIL